jgi:hypothetical protein
MRKKFLFVQEQGCTVQVSATSTAPTLISSALEQAMLEHTRSKKQALFGPQKLTGALCSAMMEWNRQTTSWWEPLNVPGLQFTHLQKADSFYSGGLL